MTVQTKSGYTVALHFTALFALSLLISTHAFAQDRDQTRKRIPGTRLTVSPLHDALPPEADLADTFSDFWEAATNLDFPYLENHSAEGEKARFVEALKAFRAGNLTAAETILTDIAARTDDTQLRDHAHTLLVIIYQGENKTKELVTLLDRFPAIIERGDMDRGEAASLRANRDAELPQEKMHIGEEPVTLPLTFAISGTPQLEVEINGVKKWFWLDTGASGTLIASDVAVAMNIPKGDPYEVDNLGTLLTLHGATVDTLKFGPMTLENYRIAILDKRFLRIAGRPISGIIGWPILRRLRLEFNYGEKKVTLQASEMRENEDRNFFWFDYPFVRLLSLEGVPLNFGLDTGADVTRFKHNMLKKLPNLVSEDVTIRGAGLGRASADRGQMLERTVFLVENARLDFRYLKSTPGASARFIAPDGRIGVDIFRKGTVVLDYPAGVFEIILPSGNAR